MKSFDTSSPSRIPGVAIGCSVTGGFHRVHDIPKGQVKVWASMRGPAGSARWLAGCAAGLAVCGLVATVGLLSVRGRGQPVALKDRLDAEADALAMLTAGGHSQTGAAPGRWQHLDPAALDSWRAWERASNEKNVAQYKNMPPTEHSAYSPTDHLLARGSAWLANDGERAPLMEEANRVLGHYDDDVHAKGGLDWNSIGAFKIEPWGSEAKKTFFVEGHEGMRGTMDDVNSHVYGQPPTPAFHAGDRSYLERQPHFRPTENVLPRRAEVWPDRMTKEDAAANYRAIADMGQPDEDYSMRRSRRHSPWVGYHLDNAGSHLENAYRHAADVATWDAYGAQNPSSEGDAMRAYIAAVNANKRGQGSAATNYIISEYKKRLAEAMWRKVVQPLPNTAFDSQAGARPSPSAQTAPYTGPAPVPTSSGYSKISPEKGPVPAPPAPAGYSKITPPNPPAADEEYSKITFQRIDRTAHEAAEAAAEDVAGEVQKAIQPLQTRISQVAIVLSTRVKIT
jgi:hypothetical protein